MKPHDAINHTLCLITIFLVTACNSPQAHYSPLNNPITPTDADITQDLARKGPISPESVSIFVTQKPDKPYRELGVLSYTTSAYLPDEETSFRLFRKRAAELGADGVIILPSREEANDLPVYNYRWPNSSIPSRTTFRGMAIQFID